MAASGESQTLLNFQVEPRGAEAQVQQFTFIIVHNNFFSNLYYFFGYGVRLLGVSQPHPEARFGLLPIKTEVAK